MVYTFVLQGGSLLQQNVKNHLPCCETVVDDTVGRFGSSEKNKNKNLSIFSDKWLTLKIICFLSNYFKAAIQPLTWKASSCLK